MRKIRGLVYALGFRPRLGSIFHSPSLSWQHGFDDLREAFIKGLNNPHNTLQKQIKENNNVE